MTSPAAYLASLPEPDRQAHLATLTDDAKANLNWHWPFWARPDQIAPDGKWATWLALAGRGWGKTEAGAQWVRQRVASGAKSIALIAETQKDLEEVMVRRIVQICPPNERPTVRYRPVRMTFPSGAEALGYNGTEPDQLRGPEFDTAWVDELAKYRRAQETWDMLQFTMRSGADPRVFVTTTPRNIPIIKSIASASDTIITRGSTFDNAVNLAPSFLHKIKERYEGTRLGRQELYAEILDDVQGALWTSEMIEETRRPMAEAERIVVAVDPSGGGGSENDEQGIVVAAKLIDGTYAVLEDASCKLSPQGWARRAVDAYYRHGADRIVAEKNFGGDMVGATIRAADKDVPVKMVTASRGKVVRAEPIAALYEQGKVSHARNLEKLEDQMIHMTTAGYVGEGSPDRVDALVWALTDLMGGSTYNANAWLT